MIKLILLCDRRDRDGGVQRQLLALAQNLDRRRFDATVVLFYAGTPLQRELEEASIRVVALGKRGRWDVFPFLYRLVSQLRALRPDVLHSYLELPNVLSMLVKPFLPHAKIVWGIRVSSMDMDRGQDVHALSQLESLLSRFANLIISNSQAGLDHVVARGFPRDNAVVIQNGIDTRRFRPDAEARCEVRAEWGVPAEAVLVGMVARLAPEKGHHTFLRAAALATERGSDLRFVCLGRGQEEFLKKLQAMSEQLGLQERVIWAGSREDVERVYNALDILTLSSSFGEGFPNVVGEAMASEVPCAVTDVGDSAQIVGETGVVVPADNPESLAEGWESLLAEGPGSLKARGRAARARIESEFSVDRLTRRTEEALVALLERP